MFFLSKRWWGGRREKKKTGADTPTKETATAGRRALSQPPRAFVDRTCPLPHPTHTHTTMAGGPADKDLPRAEAALFRSIVKHYDAKSYKKGVKAADAILK